jgi:hypothetical protein
MAAADCVIFLDTPVALCRERAAMRIEQEESERNPHITVGCVYREVKELQMDVIDHFHQVLRPMLMEHLSDLPPEKVKVISGIDELNPGGGT